MVKLQTSGLPTRVGATLLAIGYGAVGIFSLAASSEAPTPDLADRAFWMGVTFLIAAFLALSVSWLVTDLSNIWCIPARRTRQKRLTEKDVA
ncbi:MAG: hypothetical protein ACR2PG_27475 [Hyphomicrobiaceae bacterium]